MLQQGLSPGVQDREETDLGAEVLGIRGDRAQGFGTGMEQDVVERLLVLVGDGRDRLGHGKDDMEILDAVQQLGLPVFQPLRPSEGLALGTVAIAATVIRDALMAAGIALFDMATEGGGATQFDGAHGPQLPAAQRIGVRLPIARAEAAEDIRHFERWRAQRRAQK